LVLTILKLIKDVSRLQANMFLFLVFELVAQDIIRE